MDAILDKLNMTEEEVEHLLSCPECAFQSSTKYTNPCPKYYRIAALGHKIMS